MTVSLYVVSLYVALGIFGAGLFYKVSRWFRYSFPVEAGNISTFQRVSAAAKGVLRVLCSRQILTLLKVFVLDVLLQRRILLESLQRWLMHMCIYCGFMLLLLMHGLEKLTTVNLFAEYYSTINPFLFLRNLFGIIVLFGLTIAIYRRFVSKPPLLVNNFMDRYAITILTIIIISGFVLEALKISSYSKYQSMVSDYAVLINEEEQRALESYWVAKYGMVSPNVSGPFDQGVLALGEQLHDMSCSSCHSRPQWAPLSYAIAKVARPFALRLDRANVSTTLWYIHFLACFIGLAYLPFSKMFHIFTSPLSLLANAVMDRDLSDPVNIATRQIMELDACTHCVTCTLQCSVNVCIEEIPNKNILPSEKIASVKALVAGKKLTEREIRDIQEGLYLCTDCNHCTMVCPAGINLQDLWFNVRESLLQKGYPEYLTLSALSFFRGLKRGDMAPEQYRKPLQASRKGLEQRYRPIEMYDGENLNMSLLDSEVRKKLRISTLSNSFSKCFTCTTCTSACPVVQNYKKPREVLGMVPHQIIHAAVIGVAEPIFRSNMLWDCLGCYECQEHCPQAVRVTDIFYELKNLAIHYLYDGKQ